MAEFKKYHGGNSGGRPGSRPSFGNNRPSFGGQKEMFDTECNSCHKRCQVPFRPNGKKPVYCADCFVKDDSRGDSRDSRDSRGDSSFRAGVRPPQRERSFAPEAPSRDIQELKRQVETMNATLQNLVKVLENSSRASALTSEVQKHVPAEKVVAKKTTATKTPAPAKAPAKKVTKVAKPVKAPAKKKKA